MKFEEIDTLISNAMKGHNVVELNTLRLIKSEVMKFKTSISAEYIPSENDIIRILRKMASQYEDVIKEYQKANRFDLATSELMELEVIKQYLPPLPSDAEIRNFVEQCIDQFIADEENETHDVQMRDMKLILATVKDKYDAPNVGVIVKDAIMARLNK